jgi:hypothetical protein
MPLEYITLTQTSTASIQVPGYFIDKTLSVYLSSTTVNLPGTATVINNYTTNHLVSALFPSITGHNYSNFDVIDNNHIQIPVHGLTGSGYVDVILYNRAGYSKLSDRNYLIRVV